MAWIEGNERLFLLITVDKLKFRKRLQIDFTAEHSEK